MGPKSAYLRALNGFSRLMPSAPYKEEERRWRDPRIVYEGCVDGHHVPLRLLECSASDRLTRHNAALIAASKAKSATETPWVNYLATVDCPAQATFKLFKNPAEMRKEMKSVLHFAKNENHAREEQRHSDGGWKTCPVPSVWQVQFPEKDPPIYTNISFPWKRGASPLSTSVPTSDNPTGVYRLQFDVPQPWMDAVERNERNIILTLHGAGAGAEVFINGERACYGEDSMTETEVDITAMNLRHKGNRLDVVVYRWTSGSYLEDQDHWWLSGIHRDIELSCPPSKGGIADYIVETILAKDCASAEVIVDVVTTGEWSEVGVKAALYDATGKKVATAESGSTLSQTKKLHLFVKSAQLWEANNPYLYGLVLESFCVPSDKRKIEKRKRSSLKLDGDARREEIENEHEPDNEPEPAIIQLESTRVGIRDVRITRDGQLHINGIALLVAGVNRHEVDPSTGRVVSEAGMRKDIEIMKRFNFNAVRNCHYPNSHRWYELCDEYGMYVIDEANVETHGFAKAGHLSILQNSSRFKNQFMRRVQAMVRRARNHACIIAWSLGNESGCGDNARACAKWIRSVEKSRPLQYEGGIQSGDSPMLMGDGCDPHCTDIICPMYFSPHTIAEIASRTNRASGPYRKRPIILCEYAHAMGNSNGNLHLYWKLFRSKDHPKIQGGFIWDFVDNALLNEKGHWCYGGDFGETSGVEDHTFCVNGLVLPDRTIKPAMHECKYLQQPLTFELNRESFVVSVSAFSHCEAWDKLEFSFKCVSLPLKNAGGGTVLIAEGACPIERGSDYWSKVIHLANVKQAMQENARGRGAVSLIVRAVLKEATKYADAGHELAFEQFLFDAKESSASSESDVRLETKARISVSEMLLRAQGDSYVCEISMETGDLIAFTSSSGVEMVKSSRHNFFRAPTDNDVGGFDTMLPNEFLKKFVSKSQTSLAGLWRKAGLDVLKRSLVSAEFDEDDSELEVTEEFRHGKAVRFITNTTYTFSGSAVHISVDVEASSAARRITPCFPRVGLCFTLAPRLSKVEYLGLGPFECYPDRKAGAILGVHSCDVDEMHTNYIMPSESGGRSDVQWVKMHDGDSEQPALLVSYAFNGPDAKSEFFDGYDLSLAQPKRGDARPAGMQGAQMCLTRYTIGELTFARHQHELHSIDKDSSDIYLHIDGAHCGVGGDCSWAPRLHNQYRVWGERWKYKISLEIQSA